VPTVGISLVRENTAGIRPPRALWVSFDLGRPFGAPHDAGLQTRVLRAALSLLERTDGPVILEDFPEDAPRPSAADFDGLVCPVPLPRNARRSAGPAALVAAEMEALAPWQALAVQRTGRSIAGVSGLGVAEVVAFLTALFEGRTPDPAAGLTAAQTARFASEDLRNWYFEAASARPGPSPSPSAMADWFWGETAAGALILALQPLLAASADPLLRRVAERSLVPRVQQHRIAAARDRLEPALR
jgi:hypothetical protein